MASEENIIILRRLIKEALIGSVFFSSLYGSPFSSGYTYFILDIPSSWIYSTDLMQHTMVFEIFLRTYRQKFNIFICCFGSLHTGAYTTSDFFRVFYTNYGRKNWRPHSMPISVLDAQTLLMA